MLGEVLRGRRDKALIATKVWAQTASEGRAQVESALAFFDQYIDLYQIHNLVLWQVVHGKRSPVKWIRNTPTASRRWRDLRIAVRGRTVGVPSTGGTG